MKTFLIDDLEELTIDQIKAKGSGFNKWHKSEIDGMEVNDDIEFPIDNGGHFSVKRLT